MGVLTRNTRPFLYPKGTRTASSITRGHDMLEAISQAEVEFIKEHGKLPPIEERFYTIAFVTFQTICELSDSQRSDA